MGQNDRHLSCRSWTKTHIEKSIDGFYSHMKTGTRLLSINDLTLPEAILPSNLDLSEEYTKYLEEEVRDRRVPGIHASEISSCVRSSTYTLLGTEPKVSIPANMKERFEVGHAVHDMIQAAYENIARKSMGRISFQREVRVDDTPYAQQHFVSSSCDGVFTIFDSGSPVARIGLEIKTEAPDSFVKLAGPRPKHLMQAHLYMKCLDLPYMWFLYINKGNQQRTPMTAPWLVQFDPQMWEQVEKRIQIVLKSAEVVTPLS